MSSLTRLLTILHHTLRLQTLITIPPNPNPYPLPPTHNPKPLTPQYGDWFDRLDLGMRKEIVDIQYLSAMNPNPTP